MTSAYPGANLNGGATVLESAGPESEQLKAFLRMNPEEGFNLEALNSIDLKALGKEALGEKRLSLELMRKVEELLPRVRTETEDTALVGRFLRNKTLEWCQRSPSDPSWTRRMAVRWGGILHESRVPGGRLTSKLSARLEILHTECAKASGWARSLLRGAVHGKLLNRTLKRRQPLVPHVAQAYLDDLAAISRHGYRPFSLERLSELARKIGIAEVNMTFGELFPHTGSGPFIVLDPRYHPDSDAVMVRAPPPKAVADAVAYDLVVAEASLLRESAALTGVTADLSPSSPWEREDITMDDWNGLLGQLRKRKARLDPPPIENYRDRESYLELRELILVDASSCKAFLAVYWKGKPTGMALLARLLSEGTFAPDAETDGDYLEAELGHIDKGNPDSNPGDGRWDVGHGWTVTREIAAGNVRTYRADRGALG